MFVDNIKVSKRIFGFATIADNTINTILTDIFLSEPVGSSAPKFSGSDYLSGTKKHDGSPFSLSCPAQGFPAPSFRSANDCLDMLLYTV